MKDTPAAALLRDYRHARLGMSDREQDFRISRAGAQEKMGLLWYKNQWCKPLDATLTLHIFKLPIGTLQNQNIDLKHSCENEWLFQEQKIKLAMGLMGKNKLYRCYEIQRRHFMSAAQTVVLVIQLQTD